MPIQTALRREDSGRRRAAVDCDIGVRAGVQSGRIVRSLGRASRLTTKTVVRIISVVRIIIPIVGVIIQKRASKKEIAIVSETISVLEGIPVLETLLGVPQSYGHQSYARQTQRNGRRLLRRERMRRWAQSPEYRPEPDRQRNREINS
jgi:hypothetical protein